MTAIRICIPGTPVGKGRPRAAKRGANITLYTPEKTAVYENLVRLSAAKVMGNRPPLTGHVEAELWLFVTPPDSWSKKKTAAALAGEIRPTSKPDIDNTAKAIFDACNGVVFKDDAQITDVVVRKRYATQAAAHFIVKGAT